MVVIQRNRGISSCKLFAFERESSGVFEGRSLAETNELWDFSRSAF